MDDLAVDEPFDVHAHRHELKLLRQDEGSMTLANPEELGCPGCGVPFDRLHVTTDRTVSFEEPTTEPICLVRTPEELLILTH